MSIAGIRILWDRPLYTRKKYDIDSLELTLGKRSRELAQAMHPSLHPLHQAERDEEAKGLGARPGQTPGRLSGTEREHSGSQGGVRVQEGFREIPLQVKSGFQSNIINLKPKTERKF